MSKVNINEESWIEVEKVCNAELDRARARIENVNVDFGTTQYLRGKISVINAIIKLKSGDNNE